MSDIIFGGECLLSLVCHQSFNKHLRNQSEILITTNLAFKLVDKMKVKNSAKTVKLFECKIIL
jgi:hypothetical protein